MKSSSDFAGLMAHKGNQISLAIDREAASIRTTTLRHLNFVCTPPIIHATSHTNWEPKELFTGKMTAYIVLPPDKISTLRNLLRMWVTALFRVGVQCGLRRDSKTYFVLDEAAQLGQMQALTDGITTLRGYGISFLLFYQSLG